MYLGDLNIHMEYENARKIMLWSISGEFSAVGRGKYWNTNESSH